MGAFKEAMKVLVANCKYWSVVVIAAWFVADVLRQRFAFPYGDTFVALLFSALAWNRMNFEDPKDYLS